MGKAAERGQERGIDGKKPSLKDTLSQQSFLAVQRGRKPPSFQKLQVAVSSAPWELQSTAKLGAFFKAARPLSGRCLKCQPHLLNDNFLHLIVGFVSKIMIWVL